MDINIMIPVNTRCRHAGSKVAKIPTDGQEIYEHPLLSIPTPAVFAQCTIHAKKV